MKHLHKIINAQYNAGVRSQPITIGIFKLMLDDAQKMEDLENVENKPESATITRLVAPTPDNTPTFTQKQVFDLMVMSYMHVKLQDDSAFVGNDNMETYRQYKQRAADYANGYLNTDFKPY